MPPTIFNPHLSAAIDNALNKYLPGEAHGHIRGLMERVIATGKEPALHHVESTIKDLAGLTPEELKIVDYDTLRTVHSESIPLKAITTLEELEQSIVPKNLGKPLPETLGAPPRLSPAKISNPALATALFPDAPGAKKAAVEAFVTRAETPIVKKSWWKIFNEWRKTPITSRNYLAMEAREAGAAKATAAAAEHGGVVWKNAGKAVKTFGGNLVLAGLAAAGVLTLGALLSAPKLPRSRLPKFDDEESLAFSGHTHVELGSIAMPSLGQQQMAANWMSKMPSPDDQLAMNNLPPER